VRASLLTGVRPCRALPAPASGRDRASKAPITSAWRRERVSGAATRSEGSSASTASSASGVWTGACSPAGARCVSLSEDAAVPRAGVTGSEALGSETASPCTGPGDAEEDGASASPSCVARDAGVSPAGSSPRATPGPGEACMEARDSDDWSSSCAIARPIAADASRKTRPAGKTLLLRLILIMGYIPRCRHGHRRIPTTGLPGRWKQTARGIVRPRRGQTCPGSASRRKAL